MAYFYCCLCSRCIYRNTNMFIQTWTISQGHQWTESWSCIASVSVWGFVRFGERMERSPQSPSNHIALLHGKTTEMLATQARLFWTVVSVLNMYLQKYEQVNSNINNSTGIRVNPDLVFSRPLSVPESSHSRNRGVWDGKCNKRSHWMDRRKMTFNLDSVLLIANIAQYERAE